MTFLQNSTINRKSFRHRKVDNKKPLRIYTPGEINEDDCIPVSRAGIEIETGVEKEEEEVRFTVSLLRMYYYSFKIQRIKIIFRLSIFNGANKLLVFLLKIF
jgi:hypothetical protein